MSQGHDLGTLAEQTKYSESIQNSMRVPSCISLHGGEWDQKQANKFEKIQLQTPPDTLKLDDSLYWVDNRREKEMDYDDYADGISIVSPAEEVPTEINTTQYDLEMEKVDLDEMNEVEKLRHQMFKVNRRITKLERINSDLENTNKYSFYISVAALTFSLCSLLFRH